MGVVTTDRESVSVGPPFLARLVGVQTRYQAKFAIWGYLFLLPWLIVVVLQVFTVIQLRFSRS